MIGRKWYWLKCGSIFWSHPEKLLKVLFEKFMKCFLSLIYWKLYTKGFLGFSLGPVSTFIEWATQCQYKSQEEIYNLPWDEILLIFWKPWLNKGHDLKRISGNLIRAWKRKKTWITSAGIQNCVPKKTHKDFKHVFCIFLSKRNERTILYSLSIPKNCWCKYKFLVKNKGK